MIFQLLIASIVSVAICSAQIAYSRVLPYDPRYALQRIPVRRSSGTVDRIRLPITRYFPQVDTQIASAPYLSAAAVAPASYRLTSEDLYARPQKWNEDLIQVPLSILDRNDDEDYAAYEYDNEFNPVYGPTYAEEIYPQPQEADTGDLDGDLYNDLMVNYLLQPRLKDIDTAELLEIQRRNQKKSQDNIPSIANVVEANKRQESSNASPADSTSSSTTAALVLETSSSSPVSTSPAEIVSSSSPVNVLLPMGESSAAQTSSKMSMARGRLDDSLWNDFTSEERGQKEFPLFRPAKSSSPKSAWATLEEKLSRAKNSNYKSSFPLIEKLMATQHAEDPLTEQLDNLKFNNM